MAGAAGVVLTARPALPAPAALPRARACPTHLCRAGDGAAFLMGFCGMMIGLAIDLRSVLPEALATLCTAERSLAGSLALHASLLPATCLLMLGGCLLGARLGPALAAEAPPPVLDRLAGATAMVAGMGLGEWLGPRLAARFGLGWDISAMTGAMALGMLLAMAACILVRRGARRTPGR